MFGRGPLLLVAVAGALFIPYWLSQNNVPRNSAGWWGSLEPDPLGGAYGSASSTWPVATSTPPLGGAYPYQNPLPSNPASAAPGYPSFNPNSGPYGSLGVPGMPGANFGPQVPNGPPTAGPRVQSFEELFRFDVTSAWIMNRWGRVSTGLIDQDLEGLRVTVVSGTGQHDLAGSLTYYFDRQYILQRISFKGSTPDPARLVDFVIRTYGVRPDPLLGAGLFLLQEGNEWIHALRVHHAPVVRANVPQQRYAVILELNRPGTGRTLSPMFRTVLENDRRAQRWLPTPANPAVPSPQSAPPLE